HLAGAVTAVMYWLSNPIWLGGTLAVTAIAAMDTFWGKPFGGIQNTGWLEFLVGAAFIWVAVIWNILSLRQMKWVPNLGTIVRLLLIALFGGVVVVLMHAGLSKVSGFVAAYQTVGGNVLGGTGANILNFFVGAAIVFSLLTSGTVWLMSSDRLMAIGALEGSGPRAMGRFSARFGTPVRVNVLSGILATVFLLANVIVNHIFTGGNL